jgi:hypothetical protein
MRIMQTSFAINQRYLQKIPWKKFKQEKQTHKIIDCFHSSCLAGSVADPGCLSQIPNADPKISHSVFRIRILNFSIPYPT